MELSKRLQAVAHMVSAGNIVCDVGCDHGYVPVYLIQNRICPKVIAMDKRDGPLGHAGENVRAFCLEEYITLRLSDGVSALEKGEADSLILAGMGGRLIIKILSEGMDKLREMGEVILQPQSETAGVRAFLRESGFRIIREDIVYEDGKYYPVIKAAFGGGDFAAPGADGEDEIRRLAYDRYGAYLLHRGHPVLLRFLLWEQERERKIRQEITACGEDGTERRRLREEQLRRSETVRSYALSFFRDAERTESRE